MTDLLKDLGSTLSDEAKAELQEPVQPEAELPPEEGILAKLIATIEGLNTSLHSMHVQQRILENRLDTVEKYIGYLLNKDPEFAANRAAHEAAMLAAAGAAPTDK